jgi:hypothetical protein
VLANTPSGGQNIMNPRDDEPTDTAPNNRDSAGSPTNSTFGRPATEDSENQGYQTGAGLQGTFQGPRGDGAADDVDPGAAGAEETGGVIGPHAAGDRATTSMGSGDDSGSGITPES